MPGNQFNVYLGGEGEDINAYPGAVVESIKEVFQQNEAQEFADYVWYDDTDFLQQKACARFPLSHQNENKEDKIVNNVRALIVGEVVPARLPGMVLGKPVQTSETKSYRLRNLGSENLSDVQKLATGQCVLDKSNQAKVQNLIAGIHAKKIKQVNLVAQGQSVSIACDIAQRLYIDQPDIQVNILALAPILDPEVMENMILTPNVQQYVSIFGSGGGEPQFPTCPFIPANFSENRERVKLITVPGVNGNLSSLSDTVYAPLRSRLKDCVSQTLQSWNGIQVESNWRTELSEWGEIAQHINPWLSTPTQRIYQKPQGFLPIRRISAFNYNPPHPLDKHFGLSADTCTLHRDFNDRRLVQQLPDYLDAVAGNETARAEQYYQLFIYLYDRFNVRGRDGLFDSSFKALKDKAINQNIFLDACFGHVDNIDKWKDQLQALKESETPLMLAARYGQENFLQELVNRGVNLETRNTHRETALMVAAQYGQIGCLNRLAHRSSIENQIDALMEAARAKQALAFRALLDIVTLTDHRVSKHPKVKYVLMRLVENNDHETLKNLIQNNRSLINLKIVSEMTVHDYAASLNRQDILTDIADIPRFSPSSSNYKAPLAVASVLAFGYSATVLGSSLKEVAYGKFFESVLVANSIQAPVAVIAIVLAAMATVAGVYLLNEVYNAGPSVNEYASINA